MDCSILVQLKDALDSGASLLGTADLDRQIVEDLGLFCAVGVTANDSDLPAGKLTGYSNDRATR